MTTQTSLTTTSLTYGFLILIIKLHFQFHYYVILNKNPQLFKVIYIGVLLGYGIILTVLTNS